MKNSDLKEVIRESLGLNEKSLLLDESYVASPKKYDIKTELLSEKAKEAHDQLYKGYIASLNQISTQLDTADRKNVSPNGCIFRSLKQDETFCRNGVYLHELYFANSSDVHSEIMMDSLSFMRLTRDFNNSFEGWQFDFLACALSARNGWAVAGLDFYLKRYTNIFIDSHNMSIPIGFNPIVVIDCHEHAFYKDYLLAKFDYVVGQMKELNWSIIEERIKKCEKILEVLK